MIVRFCLTRSSARRGEQPFFAINDQRRIADGCDIFGIGAVTDEIKIAGAHHQGFSIDQRRFYMSHLGQQTDRQP